MAKLSSTTPSLVSNIQLPFKTHVLLIITHVFLFSINPYITSSIPIKPTDDDKYLPSDDPNITNLMVSHYDCAKQHNLRQFNLLNVKQCTEAPSNIQHANIQARVYVRAKAKRIRAFKCEAYAKKNEKSASKVMLNTDVLTELFGITIQCHYLSHLILLNVKILFDTLMELIIKYWTILTITKLLHYLKTTTFKNN